MRKFCSLFLVLTSLVFFSCESTENSVSSTDSSSNLASNSNNLDIEYIPASLKIVKTINGIAGGEIILDSTIQSNNSTQVSVSFKLIFEPNSFSGTKDITVILNPSQGSVQFFPAMTFNKSAKLDLLYSGIDLTALGFNSNSKVDFVFLSDAGKIENLTKDDVKINFIKKELSTKKALLPHFSRYAFVRKSL